MGRKILADAGYDVVTVNNGSAALKKITELKPDLIVLDVYMPGYSGLEVCQRLKDSDETAHIPVLLTVGKLEPFKADEARRVKADAHIVKPFEASELLTAITRLEDRMVPQASEGGRFSTSVSGMERFGGEDGGRKTERNTMADTGWKSRLGFPSKNKKEEPEPEDVTAGATFRDFRKGKGKTGASAAFTVKAPPPPGQEPGLVPDIPRDITADELDALSELAAKLDGPIPEAENIAPLAEQLAEKMGPVEAPLDALTAAKTEVEDPAAAAESKEEVENPAPVVASAEAAVEAPASAVEGPAPAVEGLASAVEGRSEGEIPVEHSEPASEGAAAVAESQNPETAAGVDAVAVNVAVLAEEPAPVDQTDEPMFASAASAIGQAAEEEVAEDKGEQKIEAKPGEAVANCEAAPASTLAEADDAKGLESQPEESKAQELMGEELKAEEVKAEELQAQKIEPPVPVAASVPETTEAEEPLPSDAELAEALRWLTPAAGYADVSTAPSHGTLMAAGQLLAEEAAQIAASGPRWVAEPVALSPEEAAISLEAEMFRTFGTMPATMPATIPAAAPGGEIEPVRIPSVSAIAAAVENRLAEAGLAATSTSWAERGAERRSSEHGSEATAAEKPAVEAPGEVMTAASNAASSLVDGSAAEKIAPEIEAKIAPEIAAEIAPKIEQEKVEAEKIEAEQKDSPAQVAEEAPEEEVAAATFADAVGKDEIEVTGEQNREPVSGTATAAATPVTAEENQDSSSDVGGRESMGKAVKAKSGKSKWHQIRTAPTSAAANSDVVDAAKQAEHAAAEDAAEEAPKAMAAAAAAAQGSATSSPAASVPDASTIASIVDSIMADLRPKIVEEIAKKLAGK
jgi:CheY-like chemotaxis protein